MLVERHFEALTDESFTSQLKNSSFVYHMSYAHGLSNLTGAFDRCSFATND